jgi:hypothetical protein
MTDRILSGGNQQLSRLGGTARDSASSGPSSQADPFRGARPVIATPRFNVSSASGSTTDATVVSPPPPPPPPPPFDSTQPIQSWDDLQSKLQGPTLDVSFNMLSFFFKKEGDRWIAEYKSWESRRGSVNPPRKPDDVRFTALVPHMDALLAGFWMEVGRKNSQADRQRKTHVFAAIKLSHWSSGISLWSDSSSAPQLLEATRKLVGDALMEPDGQAVSNLVFHLRHASVAHTQLVLRILDEVTLKMHAVHRQHRLVGLNSQAINNICYGLQHLTAEPEVLALLQVVTVEMREVHRRGLLIGINEHVIGNIYGLQHMTDQPQVLAFLREETVEMCYAYQQGRIIHFNTREIAHTLRGVLNLPSSLTTRDFLDAFVVHISPNTWDSTDIVSWPLFMADVLNSLRNHADAPATPATPIILNLLDVRMRQAVNCARPRHATVPQQIYALYKMSGQRAVSASYHPHVRHDLPNIATGQHMRLDFHNCSHTDA